MKELIKKIVNKLISYLYKIKGIVKYYLIKLNLYKIKQDKINLCSGPILLDDYCNIDIYNKADLNIDMERKLLPFKNNSINIVICTSAINYFTRKRGEKIIKDVFRVLKPNGVARFSTQDLDTIAKKYVDRDKDFFFQKNINNKDRFIGETFCDKFNSWFYGYAVAKNKGCKYFYDYETLSLLFKNAGFKIVEKKKYLESCIENIEKIDNRPDQMFFLEAIK
jgi:predicted SAM-dependent methyltransferase